MKNLEMKFYTQKFRKKFTLNNLEMKFHTDFKKSNLSVLAAREHCELNCFNENGRLPKINFEL